MLSQVFRLLPLFPGKYRLAKLLLKTKVLERTDVRVKGKWQCDFLLPNLKENIGFEYFINGVYEEETILKIETLIKPDAIILDVGANIGAISIPLAKRNPAINCYCIEASPMVFEYLERNISLNGSSNVFGCNFAVHEQDNLHLEFTTPNFKFGKGSYGNSFSGKTTKVNTISIDSFVRDYMKRVPDLIKVDVEGFELLVFKGARHLLGVENAPVILFEFVDWAERNNASLPPGSAQQFLMDLGYTLFLFENGRIEKIDQPIVSGSYNLIAAKGTGLLNIS